jgi:hypothetical protein
MRGRARVNGQAELRIDESDAHLEEYPPERVEPTASMTIYHYRLPFIC